MEDFNKLNKYANTAALYDGRRGIVRLHKTNIVEFTDEDSGRTIRLDSGGWRTKTTKKRMNEVFSSLGVECFVYQENRQWFIRCHNGDIPYHDGIILSNAIGSTNVVSATQ